MRTPKDVMDGQLADRKAELSEWESWKSEQIVLALGVGILGLLIVPLQANSQAWSKACTTIAGLAVSIATLCSHTIFPADYVTLRRACEKVRPILESMDRDTVYYVMPDQEANKATLQKDFIDKSQEFDLISVNMLGDESSSTHIPPSNPSLVFLSSLILFNPSWQTTVHAQTVKPPEWTEASANRDPTGTYFVGLGEGKSLEVAKDMSHNNAIYNGTQAQLSARKLGQSDFNRASALIDEASFVTNTWLVFDTETKSYKYYTRIRVPNGINDVPLPMEATSISNQSHIEKSVPVTVTVTNNSAVEVSGTGMMLMLKHMGFAPMSADLYALSGYPSSVRPYVNDEAQARSYVAQFLNAGISCKGNAARYKGYTVSCFHLSRSSVNAKHNKSSYSGVVTSPEGKFLLAEKDFKDNYVMMTVELLGK